MLSMVLAVAVGVAGCSGGGETANTGPDPATNAGSSSTTAPSDGLPPLTLLPGTTTKPTTAKPTVPRPSVVTVPTAKSTFCDYSRSIDFAIAQSDWVAGFNKLQSSVNGAQGIAPPELAQALADIKSALEAARPAVDSGSIASTKDLNEWFAKQTADIQGVISSGLLQLKSYLATNCRKT